MSHIFDALQRSDAERSNATQASSAAATELFERAERQARLDWRAESAPAGDGDGKFTSAEVEYVTHAIRPEKLATEGSSNGDSPWASENDRTFEFFDAVDAPVPPTNHLVSLTDKGSSAAEAFRLLKVRLRHLRKDKPLKKVLITSTSPQEGKSFTAGNLACTLASGSHERVLLVEGDLRRPSLSKLFGLAAKPGISEYLLGKRSLTSSAYHLKGAGICLLPAGHPEGDPLGIIQSAKLPSLMEQFAGWFDWIIIDSPPVLPLADTTAWARVADGILLVARRDVTEKRKLKKGLDAFEPEKLIGALLNSSNSASDKDYYYYRGNTAGAETPKAGQG